MSPLSTLSRLALVMFAIPLATGTAQAADTISGALGGTAGALSTVNQGLAAYGSSATQMQMLVNQLGTLNGLQGQGAAQMNQLNQIKMQLAMAVTEAQMCLQNAKKDTSKYKKATIPGSQLTTVTPTCGNYGNVIDSLKKNADEMNQSATQVACLNTLQNKINDLAESAKTPFNQLTQAANKVWQTRDKIIKIHKGIADQIDKDVNGKGGFRDQMGRLQKASIDLNEKINGFAAKVQQLKEARVTTANYWYASIMDNTQRCFESNSGQKCFDGSSLSPAQCVRKYIGSTTKDNPVSRAQAGRNSEIFNSLTSITNGQLSDIHQQIQGDAKDPNGFLKLADARFNEMLNDVTSSVNATQFVGKNVNNATLASFIRDRYRYCYNSAVNRYKSSMMSEGSEYKSSLNKITQAEAAASTEMKSMIQSTKNAMTDFRTAFTKAYNRDLSQFSANCTANEDPVQDLDCLKQVQGMLNSGINGHPETIKLSNGGGMTIDAGTMAIQIPNLMLDANGMPSTSQATTTCAGFQECITFMTNAGESHKKAELSETEAQEKFVDQHNSDIQTVMGGIGQSFQAMSQMMTQAVGAVSADLAKAGISAALNITQAKGKELEKDEKTGLYKTPESMKAAFAGIGNYSEIKASDLSKVSKSIDKHKDQLMKKMQEAAKIKSQCQVKKSDYMSAANAIGSCDSEKVCKGDNMSRMLTPLERLFRKGSSAGETDRSKDEASKAYERCMDRARKEKADPIDDLPIDAREISDAPEAKKQGKRDARAAQIREQRTADTKARDEAESSCAETAARSLQSLADESRSGLKDKNSEIVSKLRRISDNCPDDPDAAADACQDTLSVLKGFNPPSTEGETDLSESSGSGSGKHENVIRGSSGAQ